MPYVGTATWVIFLHDDLLALRDYLRTAYPHVDGDPVLFQKVLLTETDFAQLKKRGVIPFRFNQERGDIVFIPAGSAHQVCYGFGACLWLLTSHTGH